MYQNDQNVSPVDVQPDGTNVRDDENSRRVLFLSHELLEGGRPSSHRVQSVQLQDVDAMDGEDLLDVNVERGEGTMNDDLVPGRGGRLLDLDRLRWLERAGLLVDLERGEPIAG